MSRSSGRPLTLEITRLTRWDGERRVARILFAIAVLGAIALLFAPWRQSAVGTGQVIAFSPNERPLAVQAPVDGRVVRWNFREGDRVDEGDVIVELSDNDPRAVERFASERDALERRVEEARGSVGALREKLASLEALRRLEVASAEARVERSANEREAARLELEAATARQRAAGAQLERMEALERDGLSSRRDLELARRNAAQARAALESARARLSAARADIEARTAERDARASELDAQIADTREAIRSASAGVADAERELAAARRALARQDALEVPAPRSGMLTRVLARAGGAYVKQGERLAVVVPETGRRAVELFVSGNDAPLIVPGEEAQLQFQGWPAIQFSGWPEAAAGTFSGEVAFVEAHAEPSGRFRVVVVPTQESEWPDADLLRQGNAANGWILLSKVTLGYELWRRFNGFPADLPPAAARAGGYPAGPAEQPAR